MIRRSVLLYAVLLITFSSSQTFGDEKLEKALSSDRYTESQRTSIRGMFQDAENQGIDSEMLLPRIYEATAKNISVGRLVSVLAEELERFGVARELLLETPYGKELILESSAWQRAANLIAWGATDDEIRSMSNSSGGIAATFIDATHLFASLVEWGIERERAFAVVIAAMESPIAGEDYPGIIELLIQGRRIMIRPNEVISRLLLSLPRVSTFEQLKKKVLYE